jgi:hypothetical protein
MTTDLPDGGLPWLQEWYLSQCDGDWEHSYGIKIGTLDNPGWSLRIDLAETELENEAFARTEQHRSERDWLVCWIENNAFHTACGPLNMSEGIATFRAWVESRGF